MKKNANGSEGQQSPRWAFWSRFNIPCLNGEQYLARLRILDTPWFGIYLHDIFEPDGDRDPHNHPWSFISVVLRGGYAEYVFPEPEQDLDRFVEKTHRRFSVHRMGTKEAHRIVYAKPGLKTLIIRAKRQGNWGFFKRDGYVPWQEYVEDRERFGTHG